MRPQELKFTQNPSVWTLTKTINFQAFKKSNYLDKKKSNYPSLGLATMCPNLS